MFSKFFVGFLAFAIVSVQAQATTNNGLKAAFDELNYSLQVQGAANNRAANDAAVARFQARIAELQAAGLTNAELVNFAKSQVKNEALRRDIETAYSMISVNNMSASEANRTVRDIVSRGYSQGASWTSEALLLGGLVVLLLIAAVAAGGGSSSGGGSSCYDEYVCYDYYDAWGNYWYSDCGYETYCY